MSEDPAIDVFRPQQNELHALDEPLYPLWDDVISTTLDFSGIRLRNAVRT